MDMRRRKRPLGRAFLVLCLALPPSPAAPSGGAVSSWNVIMTLEVRGDYRAEGIGFKVVGAYDFAFRWTGTLEKDDEDYLLVHNRCDLTQWKIEENANVKGTARTLSTADFPGKPALNVNYILKLEDGLHVDFAVAGFLVPQTIAAHAFELIFPATHGNIAHFGGLNYDLFVQNGSNKVVIDEKAVLRGSADKAFDWTWKRQGWILSQDLAVLQANAHQAKAKIEITPR